MELAYLLAIVGVALFLAVILPRPKNPRLSVRLCMWGMGGILVYLLLYAWGLHMKIEQMRESQRQLQRHAFGTDDPIELFYKRWEEE